MQCNDMRASTVKNHMFFILKTIYILTQIAMRGRAQGPSRCFIPKSMDLEPKAGNIAKDTV